MKDWKGNKNSIYKTIGASNHTDNEREQNDYYATDPVVIDKLLTVEKPYKRVYECACGEGHLVKRLIEKDCIKEVYASDIVNRGYGFVQDFLQMKEDETSWIKDCDILTNPPYKYAKEFVLHALDLVGYGHKVYMFLKLTFLESKSRYNELFSKYPPKVIYVFSERVLCAKNGKFKEMKDGGGSAVAYAWFVWQKGWKDKTIIEWI